MFLRKSPYTYSRTQGLPRVLALYSGAFIGEIRIKPYLNALLGRGLIESYQIVDREMTMEGQQGPFAFTHIWCQRNISTAQFAFLKAHRHAPIIYDMDDLLTAIPDFVASSTRTAMKRLDWCLDHARTVTVATERLKDALDADRPAVAKKIVVLKNGCAQSDPPEPRAHRQLVWTSSDVPFFLRENPQFATDLATLLNRESFGIILIGRFDDDIRKLFKEQRHIAHLDFASYRQYLRTLSGSVAIAPLPTRLPPHAQRYFDAKSDIKLVDYLSSGLIPVVSNAASYATSELFMPQLAAGTAADMLARIERCITDLGGAMRTIDAVVGKSGLLRQREFGELTKVLDPLFS